MSAYAFFIQTCREEHKQQHPGETIVFRDFSKKCADRWKTLSDVEKQHFSDMATQDRARYAKELQSYRGPRIRNRRRKTRKDPRAPKRALSAFFWFCSDERPKVRAVTPNASVGKVARELGMLWASAEQDVKDKYEKMAIKDKQRYEEQMEAYKKGDFSRHVEGMEDLPPPDPNNLGKLPNIKKYKYVPPKLQERPFLGHTIGMGQGSLGGAGEEEATSSQPHEEDDDDEGREPEEDYVFDGEEGGEDEDEEDEMVSDEEMEDNGSVIEDDMPDRGLPPPDLVN